MIFTARTGHIAVRCLTHNVRRLEATTGGTWRDMAAHGCTWLNTNGVV
jgi:hypothetical protein